MRAAEGVLQIANPKANPDAEKGLGLTSHSFLVNLNIDSLNKAALEDYEDSITNSQFEAEESTLIPSGKRTVIPFKPARSVEDEVAQKDHMCWKLGNLNLVAPIARSTWRIWIDLKPAEINESRKQALWGKNFISSGTAFAHAFPISAFDYRKCDVPQVKLHVKQPCPIGVDRRQSHSKEMWNIFRPYMRCTCSSLAVRACNGAMVWYNHAVWYVLNHLDKFFPHSEHPSLMAKFVAFIIWVSGPRRLATLCQIAFNQTRAWMCSAILQYAKNPADDCVILPGLHEAGPRLIERHIKSKAFSIANPKLPSSRPTSKKQKINLNSMPAIASSYSKQNTFSGTSSYSREARNLVADTVDGTKVDVAPLVHVDEVTISLVEALTATRVKRKMFSLLAKRSAACSGRPVQAKSLSTSLLPKYRKVKAAVVLTQTVCSISWRNKSVIYLLVSTLLFSYLVELSCNIILHEYVDVSHI